MNYMLMSISKYVLPHSPLWQQIMKSWHGFCEFPPTSPYSRPPRNVENRSEVIKSPAASLPSKPSPQKEVNHSWVVQRSSSPQIRGKFARLSQFIYLDLVMLVSRKDVLSIVEQCDSYCMNQNGSDRFEARMIYQMYIGKLDQISTIDLTK